MLELEYSETISFNNKAPATSGTAILYGNGSGGFSNVTIGTGLSFSTGTLSSSAPAAVEGMTVHTNTITTNYTFSSGYNGISGGPITINSGATVTVDSTNTWTIV